MVTFARLLMQTVQKTDNLLLWLLIILPQLFGNTDVLKRFNGLLVLLCLVFSNMSFAHSYSYTFNRPQNTQQANYTIELLQLAYADMGFKLNIVDFNRQNALFAADNGMLDGQLARDISIESAYKNLIRVNYPLFKFNLELYKRCEPSSTKTIDSVAIISSYPVQQRYLDSIDFQGKVIEVKNNNTQLNLLIQQKVQGALLIDFAMANKTIPPSLGCYEKQVVATYPLYHYLHNSHADIVPQLEATLDKLHNNGTVAKLRSKYNLQF